MGICQNSDKLKTHARDVLLKKPIREGIDRKQTHSKCKTKVVQPHKSRRRTNQFSFPNCLCCCFLPSLMQTPCHQCCVGQRISHVKPPKKAHNQADCGGCAPR